MTKRTIKLRITDNRGFSIIEIGVMVIVAGLFVVGLMKGLMMVEREQELAALEETMTVIQTALQDYIFDDPNDDSDPDLQAFPCPADPTLAPTAAGFGEEYLAAPAAPHTCHPSLLSPGPPGPDSVAIGTVPTRTLGIANKYMLDPWGNRITYAVTDVLAEEGAMAAGTAEGAIEIVDEVGNTVNDTARFIIISHGRDGIGAFTASGAAHVNACGGQENCNNDGVFLERRRSVSAVDAFDDTTMYSLVDEKDDEWWVASRDGEHIYTRNPGNLGIGTTGAPEGRVHVNAGNVKFFSGQGFLERGDAMIDEGDIILRNADVRVGGEDDAACTPAPNDGDEGIIRYNDTLDPPEHEFCDGICWQPLSGVRETGESRQVPCPPPQSGYILEFRSKSCPAGPWGPWTQTRNFCAENCDVITETRNEDCPDGESGAGNVYERTVDSCTGAGVAPMPNWTIDPVASDCTPGCTAETEQRVVDCIAPETGTGIIEQRTRNPDCTWNAWTVLDSSGCTASPCTDQLLSWGSDASCQDNTGSGAHGTTVTIGSGTNTAEYECVNGNWQRLSSTCSTGGSCTNWSTVISNIGCPSTTFTINDLCQTQTGSALPLLDACDASDPSNSLNDCMDACDASSATCCSYGWNTQNNSLFGSVVGTTTTYLCTGTQDRSTVERTAATSGGQRGRLCLDCPGGGTSVNAGTVTTANIDSTCASLCGPTDECCIGNEDTGSAILPFNRDCPDTTPVCADPFSFTDLTDQAVSTPVTSDIVQITGLTGPVNISVSGGGNPQYRICTNGTSLANCDSSEIAAWSGSQRSIDNNQYVQMRLTTAATADTVTNATLSIGTCTSDTWSVRTAGGTPYDAVCGAADGLSFTNPPSNNLCEDGSQPNVTDTGSTFDWTCPGANGGADAPCSATKRVDGQCGPADGNDYDAAAFGGLGAADLCTDGTASVPSTNERDFTWTCTGPGGGAVVNCMALRNIDGECNPAGTTVNYYPPGPAAADRCQWPGGEPAPLPPVPQPSVTELATTFNWTCPAVNNGTDASCFTGKNIDAVCDPATDGQNLTTMPTANLCMDGATPAVTDTGTQYTWTCPGTNDGADDSCAATKVVGGACGSVNGTNQTSLTSGSANLCNEGSVVAFTNNGGSGSVPYRFDWTCDVADPGTDANCSAGHRINGACGPAHGTDTDTAPSGRATLCTFDDENLAEPIVTENSDTYTWTCRGVNGGINAACSANKLSAITFRAGCYVDTHDFDLVREGGCASEPLGEVCTSTDVVQWSAGDILNAGGDAFITSVTGYTITWTGACVNTGRWCSATLPNGTHTANVQIVHDASGTVVFTDSITAEKQVRNRPLGDCPRF